MKFHFVCWILLGAGFWACSSANIVHVKAEMKPVVAALDTSSSIDSIVRPYHDTLQQQMSEVIAEATVDFVGGRPVSSLGNWVTDALFANQTKFIRLSTPVFCLLNTGGLRASINKGPVTLGDLYKLMPFDNELVWVRLPANSLNDIAIYLKTSGGEPLSNASISKGKLLVNGWRDTTSSFWVITSDYLLNGGDKMTFFQKKMEVNHIGKLLRDALIEEARFQQVLQIDSTIRIKWD